MALLLGCGSCGAAPAAEVRWPASADTTLAAELAASQPGALLPDGQRVDENVELPPDAPNVHARARVFEGLWYAEVRLGEASEDTPLPLVLMLHGRGDRPRIPGGPFGRVPTPMRVLVPRGPLALGSGYAWARHSVREVDHLDDLAQDLVAVAERLVRLLRHVRKTRPTAGTPIVTGFSQGAITAWTAAVRHPSEIGLALPIAGWVPPGARPSVLRGDGAPPTRAMHGTEDPIVRIEPTREWVALLRQSGYEVELREFEGVGHVVTPEMNLLFEEWLEEALRARAPDLRGGLGEEGPDPEAIEPFEPAVEGATEEEARPAPLPEDMLRPEEIEAPSFDLEAPSFDEPPSDDSPAPGASSPDDEPAPADEADGSRRRK